MASRKDKIVRLSGHTVAMSKPPEQSKTKRERRLEMNEGEMKLWKEVGESQRQNCTTVWPHGCNEQATRTVKEPPEQSKTKRERRLEMNEGEMKLWKEVGESQRQNGTTVWPHGCNEQATRTVKDQARASIRNERR